MKAILLIDVPDNTEFDKDYRLTGLLLANEYAENVGIEFKGARLRPVPEKRYIRMTCNSDGERWAEFSSYDMGYNKCIDEILGEENAQDNS